MTELGWAMTGDRGEPLFVLGRDSGVELSIYVDVNEESYGVFFNPSLGVGHVEVGKLVSRFNGLPEDSYGSASIGAALSDFLAKEGETAAPYSRWLIRNVGEVELVAGRLVDDVGRYAIPHFSTFRSLDDIVQALREENRYQALSAHLAVACMVSGKSSEAVDVLAEYVGFVSDRNSAMWSQTRRFAMAFMSYFELDPQSLPFGKDLVEEG